MGRKKGVFVKYLLLSTVITATVLLISGYLPAAMDHSAFITGPFKDGPEVTKACLQCHQQNAQDFMKTVHWTWSARQKVEGKGEVDLGKKNAINNFCIALPANEPRCTSCHAGYGWKDSKFDFSKAENIDCLVCHETTGNYKKLPTAAGHPAYKDMEFPPKSGKMVKATDLVQVAKGVGKTSRRTCGVCHFFGGGGDHIKHGDLDSSLTSPNKDMDVHMAVEGRNMTCTACHKTAKHVIAGKALSVSPSAGRQTLNCDNCHTATPHKGNSLLDKHYQKVACQACHIPTFARTLPTKVWWDWSTAGQNKPVPKDQYGQPMYEKIKGDWRWEKDVVPTYMWFNGTVDRSLIGDKIDPGKLIHLNYPRGSRDGANAKITPFKVIKGKQPYDSVNNILATPHLFGKGGYWDTFDWGSAIASGMKAANLPYSGKFGWVETDMYWNVNHMVVPKNKTLSCNDCHSEKGRLDWKALGYSGDPQLGKK